MRVGTGIAAFDQLGCDGDVCDARQLAAVIRRKKFVANKSVMKHGEAWLLETLAMFRLPVYCLTRNEHRMREWLNRGHHGLATNELVQTLQRLFESGDIEAFSDYDDDHGFCPSESQLQAAIQKRDKNMTCSVSRQGWARWESLANPDWRRYFEDIGRDGSHMEITAGSRDRLLEIVDNAEILWRVKMNSHALVIERIAPWEPFPWKRLPEGFRANVPYEEIPSMFRSWEDAEAEHRRTRQRHVELRTWAKSICGHAYV
jgi:hypothetical protein